MADVMVGPINMRFVNGRKSGTDMGGSDSDVATPLNYTSISGMRTRLAAINGAYYTTARLDAMTSNDMVYALRLHDDATSVGSHLSNVVL